MAESGHEGMSSVFGSCHALMCVAGLSCVAVCGACRVAELLLIDAADSVSRKGLLLFVPLVLGTGKVGTC